VDVFFTINIDNSDGGGFTFSVGQGNFSVAFVVDGFTIDLGNSVDGDICGGSTIRVGGDGGVLVGDDSFLFTVWLNDDFLGFDGNSFGFIDIDFSFLFNLDGNGTVVISVDNLSVISHETVLSHFDVVGFSVDGSVGAGSGCFNSVFAVGVLDGN